MDPHLAETPKHSQVVWLSLLWGHFSFLMDPCALGLGCALRCLCFPSPVELLLSPTDPSMSDSLGMLSPLLDPQVGKSVVVPRTFATVQELLGIVVLVCGSPTWQLCGGASGNLFQSLLHRLCVRSTHSSVSLPGFRFQLCDRPEALCASTSHQ